MIHKLAFLKLTTSFPHFNQFEMYRKEIFFCPSYRTILCNPDRGSDIVRGQFDSLPKQKGLSVLTTPFIVNDYFISLELISFFNQRSGRTLL